MAPVALIGLLLSAQVALAAPGDLDPTFGTGGVVVEDLGADDVAFAVAIQPDGRIIAAGTSGVLETPVSDFALTRYQKDGTLDETFGDGGVVLTDFGGFDQASAVVVQRNKRILVAGSSDDNHIRLARYRADGSLDEHFGDDGSVMLRVGAASVAGAMALDGHGRILIAGGAFGEYGLDFLIARLMPNGRLDRRFGTGGVTLKDLGEAWDVGYSIGVARDGRVLVAGASGLRFAVMRYTRRGVPDAAFGVSGAVVTSFAGGGYATALSLQRDGGIIVAGYAWRDDDQDFAVCRFDDHGSLDADFGTAGVAYQNLGGSEYPVFARVLADDSIVVAGTSYTTEDRAIFVSRFLPDGEADFSVLRDLGTREELYAAALQRDGRLLGVGTVEVAGHPDLLLTRLDL